jgi:hypothetical protein
MKAKADVIIFERIDRCIYLLRGQKVMLSTDLARLYGVEPKVLMQAVKRNTARFPGDFMFPLARQEVTILKSQIVTSSWGGIRRAMPYAFTEQGVAMLSSVLNSPRAIEVNIAIMRAFVRLREFLMSQAKLAKRLRQLEQEVASQGKAIGTLFDAMHEMTTVHSEPVGYQYVDAGEDASVQGKTVQERRDAYRTASTRKAARKAQRKERPE